MQQEKFKVIGFIRDLINNVDKNLENFPKKDIEIKNRIRNASYDLLELAYEANTTEVMELKVNLIINIFFSYNLKISGIALTR